MKFFIVGILITFLVMVSLEAISQNTAIYIKYKGRALNQYGSYVILEDGWYEFDYDDGIYTYILYKDWKFRILKTDSMNRTRKIKRFNKYYNV